MLFMPTAGHHESLVNLLAQRWHAWKEQRDSLAQLESCGRGEVARIAHDLSLSTSELRSLARKGPDAADLLYRRMDDVGLDCDSITRRDQKAMWDMQKACSLCNNKGRCRHDLARGAEASAWHPYCPNDDTLTALIAGGAHPARHGSTGALSAAIADHDRRGIQASLLGLLLVALAWFVLLAAPPGGQHSNLRRLAPIAPPAAIASTAPALACLDASCLSAQQRSALHDLRAVRALGWIRTSADQIASLPRLSILAQGVQDGEALACTRQGGSTYYGFMFQDGCSAGATEAARLDGFNECRPLAGGGVCLLK